MGSEIRSGREYMDAADMEDTSGGQRSRMFGLRRSKSNQAAKSLRVAHLQRKAASEVMVHDKELVGKTVLDIVADSRVDDMAPHSPDIPVRSSKLAVDSPLSPLDMARVGTSTSGHSTDGGADSCTEASPVVMPGMRLLSNCDFSDTMSEPGAAGLTDDGDSSAKAPSEAASSPGDRKLAARRGPSRYITTLIGRSKSDLKVADGESSSGAGASSSCSINVAMSPTYLQGLVQEHQQQLEEAAAQQAAELVARDVELADQQAQIDAARALAVAANEEAARLRSELEAASDSSALAEQLREQLSLLTEEATNARRELELETQRLRGRLAAAQSTVKGQEAKLRAYVVQAKAAAATAAAQEERIAAQAELICSQDARLRRAEEALARAADDTSRLRAERDGTLAEAERLAEELASAKKAAQQQQRQAVFLKVQVKQQDGVIEGLYRQLDTADSWSDALQNEYQALVQRLKHHNLAHKFGLSNLPALAGVGKPDRADRDAATAAAAVAVKDAHRALLRSSSSFSSGCGASPTGSEGGGLGGGSGGGFDERRLPRIRTRSGPVAPPPLAPPQTRMPSSKPEVKPMPPSLESCMDGVAGASAGAVAPADVGAAAVATKPGGGVAAVAAAPAKASPAAAAQAVATHASLASRFMAPAPEQQQLPRWYIAGGGVSATPAPTPACGGAPSSSSSSRRRSAELAGLEATLRKVLCTKATPFDLEHQQSPRPDAAAAVAPTSRADAPTDEADSSYHHQG